MTRGCFRVSDTGERCWFPAGCDCLPRGDVRAGSGNDPRDRTRPASRTLDGFGDGELVPG